MKTRIKTTLITLILSIVSLIWALYVDGIYQNILIGIMGSGIVSSIMEFTNYLSEYNKYKSEFFRLTLWTLIYMRQYIYNVNVAIENENQTLTEETFNLQINNIRSCLNGLNSIDECFYENNPKCGEIEKKILEKIILNIENNQLIYRCNIISEKIKLKECRADDETVYSKYLKEELTMQKEKMQEKVNWLEDKFEGIANKKFLNAYHKAKEIEDQSLRSFKGEEKLELA